MKFIESTHHHHYHIHGNLGEVLGAIDKLERKIDKIMGNIQALTDSVEALRSSNTAGFTGVADALVELSEDVARQNARIVELLGQIENPAIESQIAAITEETTATSQKFSQVAADIRAAIETPVAPEEPTEPTEPEEPTDPTPPVEEEPLPEEPVEEEDPA